MKTLIKSVLLLLLVMSLTACVGVRQQDLDSWVGQPVSALETHPFFLTVPVIKTIASDGTEIWNYKNSVGLIQGSSSLITVKKDAACNNIFYIKDGVVLRYIAQGTGGVRCMTNAALQPQFRGSTNLR